MKKFLNGLFKVVFSRTMIILLIIILQMVILIGGGMMLTSKFPYVYEGMVVLATLIMIYIINKDEPAEFKLTWAVFMMLLPVVGILLYVFHTSNWGMVRLKKKADEEIMLTKHLISNSDGTVSELKREPKTLQNFAFYMDDKCGFPTYHNTRITYYDIGEKQIEAIKEELRKAKKFIFMEYFIISEGEVWDSILEILKEKVKEGVEVKVMYDGLCSLLKLPYHYPKELQKLGIDAKQFAPVIPFLSTTQNNRDHRKILVIDGTVGFTGGINLADEYANLIEVYGHWKDVGIKIEGRAVMSLTRMFIQNWNLYGKLEVDYEKYLDFPYGVCHFDHDGYIIPYGDAPTVKYEIGKTVYENIFQNATEYVHIMMPYFIIDREFLSTIEYAALRGVDVRLILPHIPDKKAAFAMARTFYPDLLEAGVKVYEYTPGFVHAKVVVSDNTVATVGSVNLDYRSFYHHFENGVYMNGSSAVLDVEKDFQNTLLKCQEITVEYYQNLSWIYRFFGRVLRLIAPLM